MIDVVREEREGRSAGKIVVAQCSTSGKTREGKIGIGLVGSGFFMP